MRMKKYTEYKDSGIEWIGEIPDYWNISKAKYHVLSTDGGIWGDDPVGDDSDIIVLRSTEQSVDGKWQLYEPATRCLHNCRNVDSFFLDENDLLMTKSSGSELHIGKTTLVTREIASMSCCYSNFTQRIRIFSKDSAKYFWYIFNSSLAREQFVFLQNSTSGLGNINADNIKNIWVPDISLAEQERIVYYLDRKTAAIDALIADKQKLIELLMEKRITVISQAVMKGLEPAVPMKDSGTEWIGEIPTHWDVLSNHQLFVERNQKNTDANAELLSVTKYLGVILQSRAEELRLATIAPADSSEGYKIVKKGDLVMNIMRAKDGSYGISSYDGVISPAYCIYQARKKSNTQFLYYLFKTPKYVQIFKCYSTGIAEHRMRLYPEDFNQIHAILPPIAEQDEIVKKLDAESKQIDKVIALIEQQIEKLKEYRLSIISEVVTGKVVV